MKAPCAVFDTNVVVSALLFSAGRLAWLRAVWAGGTVVPLVSAATTRELLRVLTYPKFKLTATEREELLGDYLTFARVVEVPNSMTGVPHCRDHFDFPFLKLALVARAGYLVTGDQDLLEIRQMHACRILTPEAFRQAMSAK